MSGCHRKLREMNAMLARAVEDGVPGWSTHNPAASAHEVCQLPTVRYVEGSAVSLNQRPIAVPIPTQTRRCRRPGDLSHLGHQRRFAPVTRARRPRPV